jgi:hypothetical protein
MVGKALITGAVVLCVAAQALAHRMPGSISTVKPGASGDVGRAQLALYVEERFGIAGAANGTPGDRLPLELIGAELDGEFVLVYQEYAGDLPGTIAIRDDILRDVFPDQVNHVNVAAAGEVRSVTFSEDDEWRILDIDQYLENDDEEVVGDQTY